MDRAIPTNIPDVKQAKASNPAKGGARVTKVPKARVPKVLKPKVPKAAKVTKPKVSKNAKIPDAATPNQNTADMSESPIKDEVDSEDELFVQPEPASSEPVAPLTPPIDDETEITLALVSSTCRSNFNANEVITECCRRHTKPSDPKGEVCHCGFSCGR